MNRERRHQMDRRKQLLELKKQHEEKNPSGYTRFWEIINGIPTLVKESKGVHGKITNIINSITIEDKATFEQYSSDQLEELAEEQKKDNIQIGDYFII